MNFSFYFKFSMVVTHSQSYDNSCLVRCDGCLMNISSIMWVQCVQCEIDICPLCVIQRAAIRTHEYTHKYRIVKSLLFEGDTQGWHMIEEFLFVDGIIMHGIGNWEDVATYIGRKTPLEVKTHFLEIFKYPDTEDLEGEAVQNVQSLPLSQEISGYMPLREDFEVEYSNDAEVPIKEISFAKTDTLLEKETKEVLLESYRNILQQRRLFRHLIFKKGLLSAKQHTIGEKSLCAAGKNLLGKMKPLLKVLSKREYLILFEGFYLEMKIRKKLSEMYSTQEENKGGVQAKKSFGLTDDTAEGYLSEKEKVFCNMVSVPLGIYHALKEIAVLYRAVTETEKKQILKMFQGLTEQKLSKIVEYFVRNRWIESPTPSLP